MADENEALDTPPFGHLHPRQRLYALDQNADRERGFLTENDRRYLTRRNLSKQSERRARMRIRDRTLSAYFDARFLQYLSDEDRRQIFQKARNDFDLHLREAVKEFVRFTHHGLYEFDVDTTELIEQGILEAERDRAATRGEVVDVEVDVTITREDGPTINELQARFEDHKRLSRSELAALVNSQYTGIDLVDALDYQARQLDDGPRPPEHTVVDAGSGASQYSWEDPDAEETEQILDWLRSFFEEHGIDSYREYEVAYDRLKIRDDEEAEQLWEKIQRLSRCAPQFEEQLAEEAGLSTNDMQLLHDILWNPENIDVETALEKEVRPPTAGSEWDPADDEYLQKFIARVQVARRAGGLFTSGGEDGRERWERVLTLAEFDSDEWGDYMQEQYVQRCEEAIESLLESVDSVSRQDLAAVLEEVESENSDLVRVMWDALPPEADTDEIGYLASSVGDAVVHAALRNVVEASEGQDEL